MPGAESDRPVYSFHLEGIREDSEPGYKRRRFRNVTERKQLEETIDEREAELEEMSEHTEMLLGVANALWENYDVENGEDDDIVAGLKKLLGGIDTLESMASPHDES